MPEINGSHFSATGCRVFPFPANRGQKHSIELKNAGAADSDLNGWPLTGAGAAPAFTTSVIIPPGGYLIVPCSAAAGSFHLPVALPDAGGIVQLFTPAGVRADAFEYGNQVANFSVGRIGTAWVLNSPTPGADNMAAAVAPNRDIALNEWLANPKPRRE
ncbi:MAG: hypothetical protein JWL59_4718 [Chthoniobacteraceae bacterium]|nr:hypothetical protein [Chthoniobacteraceae bacterium]